MIIKFKSLDRQERSIALLKLALCFLAGVLSAVLLFEFFVY